MAALVDVGASSELALLAPLAAQGIDIESGLARYLNRKSFYISVLRGFYSEYGAAVHRLPELHTAGAREEIFRLAHTLKANADGIGAAALAEIARSVEDTAKTQLPDQQAITRLVNALVQVLEALETIAQEPAAHVEIATAPVDMVAGLQDLIARLQDDDATSFFDPALDGVEYTSIVATPERRTNAFFLGVRCTSEGEFSSQPTFVRPS